MRRHFSILMCATATLTLASCQNDQKKPAVGTVNKTNGNSSTVTRSPARTSHQAKKPTPRKPPKDSGDIVRVVRCIYDQNPWLNLDKFGDRDPEGVWFRAFLDVGNNYGVHRDGTIHVDLYKIERVTKDQIERTLVSDWHYPTGEINTIQKPGMLGEGYVLQLVWADKKIAGSEVEIIVRYEDAEGNIARSGTKRMTVPKYST